MLQELLEKKSLIVCVGSGGVGKTTISASLALAAALDGKKSLVVTIDPAKRLADALGIAKLGNEEFEIDLSSLWELEGKPEGKRGRLFAMMLDHKLTFDRLVEQYSPSVENAERLKANPWYQQMSSALSGIQDYMAVEKLYEMATARDYDLIVLDTPPTANALDFLEAPNRLMDFLGFQPFRWMQKTVGGEGKTGRFLRWGGTSLIRGLGRITGEEVVEDMLQLMKDLSGFYDGFKDRAARTWSLLRSDSCSFFVVTIPQHLSLLESLFFYQKLQEAEMPISGFWINRGRGFYQNEKEWYAYSKNEHLQGSLDSVFSSQTQEDLSDKEEALLSQLSTYFEADSQEVEQARKEVVFLREQVGDETFIGLLPVLQKDIHELRGLAEISQLLLKDGVDM